MYYYHEIMTRTQERTREEISENIQKLLRDNFSVSGVDCLRGGRLYEVDNAPTHISFVENHALSIWGSGNSAIKEYDISNIEGLLTAENLIKEHIQIKQAREKYRDIYSRFDSIYIPEGEVHFFETNPELKRSIEKADEQFAIEIQEIERPGFMVKIAQEEEDRKFAERLQALG